MSGAAGAIGGDFEGRPAGLWTKADSVIFFDDLQINIL
jgi:hypothetical protein